MKNAGDILKQNKLSRNAIKPARCRPDAEAELPPFARSPNPSQSDGSRLLVRLEPRAARRLTA